MTKKSIYRFFAFALALVFSITIVNQFIIAEKSEVEKEQSSDTEDSQQTFVSDLEATVPVLDFKLNATLVFVFEVFSIQIEEHPNSLYEEILFLSSYKTNLFSSTICVNAP